MWSNERAPGLIERPAARARLLRATLALSVLWIAAICAIALYEYATVDPWQFLGEDRGAIFFRWSPHLVYDRSPFGDFVLRLDPKRFWLTLVLPVCGIWILARALAWFMRSKAGRG
jgi:hypothetical protein